MFRFKGRVRVFVSFWFLGLGFRIVISYQCFLFNVWLLAYLSWGSGFMVGLCLRLMLGLGLGFDCFLGFRVGLRI